MNIQKLKGRMAELNITGCEMARQLGMDPSTFYRKMQNEGKNFTVQDLYYLKRVLQLNNEQAADILLAQ